MSFSRAKQAFTDAKRYVNAQNDPVMHDIVVGLFEMTKELEDRLRSIEQIVQDVKTRTP